MTEPEEKSQRKPVNLRRGLLLSMLIASLVVLPVPWGMLGPAMVIGAFAMMINIIGVLMGIVTFKFDHAALHGGRALIYFLLLLACAGTISDRDNAALDASTRIIVALENYHDERNEYPQTLEGLVPRYLSAVPLVVDMPLDRGEFRYWKLADAYNLGYGSGFMYMRIYESNSGLWATRD